METPYNTGRIIRCIYKCMCKSTQRARPERERSDTRGDTYHRGNLMQKIRCYMGWKFYMWHAHSKYNPPWQTQAKRENEGNVHLDTYSESYIQRIGFLATEKYIKNLPHPPNFANLYFIPPQIQNGRFIGRIALIGEMHEIVLKVFIAAFYVCCCKRINKRIKLDYGKNILNQHRWFEGGLLDLKRCFYN